MALGMGQVRTTSKLGDPLEFSVALLSQAGDAIAEDCVAADVFSGASRIPDAMVRWQVDRSPSGVATRLRVTTGVRIEEPLARVELSFNCGASLKRSYVVFIDPPVLELAQAGSEPPAPTAIAPRPLPSRVQSTPSRSRSSRSAARSTRESRRPAASRSSTVGSSGAAPRQQRAAVSRSARQARAAAAEPPSGSSSLKLESAPPTLSGAPVNVRPPAPVGGSAATTATAGTAAGSVALSGASGSASAAAPTASAAVSGLLGELAAKAEADSQLASLEKVRLMEENLNKLRTDNQSMQQSMAELRARLEQAEGSSASMGLVYALLGLLLALLLVIVALLWRQAGLRRESDWLKAAAAEDMHGDEIESIGAPRSIVRPSVLPSAKASAEATAAAARLAEAATKPGPRSALATAAAIKATAVVAGADQGTEAAKALPTVPHEITAIHDPRHEVSVDELIDLEQQADFFGVLGQDDAAIDLLMGHLQGTGGVSPLPYLKLLEIHRRRNERSAYDRVRERFNRRFDAFAPEWEAHSGHDRSLQDYPPVIGQLQKQWPTPVLAMETLAALLFQRDDSGQTFDLPAYGELLFLYSLARDLAEHEPPAGGVDLLLPLDGKDNTGGQPATVAAAASAAAAAAMSAARPAAASPKPLDTRPQDELDELPDLEWLSESRLPTDVVPLDTADPKPPKSADQPGGSRSNSLDLNIHDEPEEPKGPLSKY